MTKQPSYRFTGLEDDWKEVKLGEVFDIVTDYVANGSFESLRNNVKTYEKDNFAYMIRLQDASNSWKGPWLYTDERGYNFLSKSRLFKDDILMSNVGTVGRFFQVPELDRPMTLAPNSVLIRSTSSNNQFLYFMMLTANIQDQIAMRKTPGVQDKINKTDFKKVIATLPSLLEQTAIGSFFQDIDQLISLQQRKLEVLKEQKKTYLKLLFPAKGQTKPVLRFAGFEDEWQRQNFGDYLVEYNEKTVVENQHELLSSTNNGIEPRVGRVSGESNLGYKVLKKDMIVLSPQNLWLGNINYNSKYDLGIVSPSYKIFNIENVDKKFISILIRHPYMIYEYGQASVQGASVVRRNLDIDLFNSIQILLPSLEEQSLIGSFFQDLDKAIAKQEEKVNQLKESKQTLLRKMFI